MNRMRYFRKRCASRFDAVNAFALWTLASPYLNLPGFILPDQELGMRIAEILGEQDDPGEDGLLVRLCQEYSLQDLPIRDMTQAVAAELAFSVWVNRRDAHNGNRCYVAGTPMFFDLDTALTPDAAPAAFLRPGEDSGYVPNWRVLNIAADRPVSTRQIRALERQLLITIHPVHDLGRFWQHFEAYGAFFRDLPATVILQAADVITDPDARASFTSFLRDEQDRLDAKLAAVKTVLGVGACALPGIDLS